jgi:hypothetical protein
MEIPFLQRFKPHLHRTEFTCLTAGESKKLIFVASTETATFPERDFQLQSTKDKDYRKGNYQ